MLKDCFVFIDTEFSPVSRRWLSLGATIGEELFYAYTSDSSVLSMAEAEFSGNPIGEDVLGQLSIGSFSPGPVDGLATMALAFSAWINRADSRTVQICYDFSWDMQLLEDAVQSAGLIWPASWRPCNLAILNREPAADAARDSVWAAFRTRHGIGKHHALADAVALQAAYSAQSTSSP